MSTGLVFGVFDGLHDGHRAMFEQARSHVDRLVVALPLDQTVKALKLKDPSRSWNERAQTLRDSGLVDDVVSGDEAIGEYGVIKTVNPDKILLGYDQISLVKDLRRFLTESSLSIPIIILKPFKPDQFKSSLLNSV